MKTMGCLLIAVLPLFGQIDPQKFHFQLNYKPGDWITVADTRIVTSIAVTYNEAFIGTLGGVLRYNWLRQEFNYPLTTSCGMLDNEVVLVAADNRNGFVWIATRQGLNLYNSQSELFFTSVYAASGIDPNERVLSIGFDQSQTWIHTARGFYMTSPTVISLSRAANGPPKDIVWTGALAQLPQLPTVVPRQEFGYHFQISPPAFVDREFRQYPVVNYTRDLQGNFWVATLGAGAWYLNGASYIGRPIFYGIASGDVRAMIIDGSKMWFAGRPTEYFSLTTNLIPAITEWDQDIDRFTYYPSGFVTGLQGDITSMLVDSANIWVGTDRGVLRRSRTSDNWTLYGRNSGLTDGGVLSLAQDERRVFVGTESGLNIMTEGDKDWVINQVEISALRRVAIYAIHLVGADVWLGTDNGIYRINQREEKWYHYDGFGNDIGAATLASYHVRGVTEDDERIYFISQRSIVAFLKSSSTWESVDMNLEFLTPGVNAAAADDKNLWIGTNAGLLRLYKSKKKWFYYSTQDGLAGDQIRTLLTDGDYLWAGTNAGVTQFHWNAPHLAE
jgi:ligand-binding sensor domain-containing protein